jgi:shikimate dehydrogenase
MKIYGLIGNPLGHSFSQEYFAEKFKKECISDSAYINFETNDLSSEIALLKNDSRISGLNITIPYKTEIISFLDEMSLECKEINACNCIKIDDGKWTGFNTDLIGFKKSFAHFLKPYHNKALILGTGGSSKAVEYALKELHIDFLSVSRIKSNSANTITYESISAKIMAEHLVVINTTPLGMFPNVDDYPKIPYNYISDQHYFFDLIYNPVKTRFLEMAESKGATCKNGGEMLALQAEESWRIWKR